MMKSERRYDPFGFRICRGICVSSANPFSSLSILSACLLHALKDVRSVDIDALCSWDKVDMDGMEDNDDDGEECICDLEDLRWPSLSVILLNIRRGMHGGKWELEVGRCSESWLSALFDVPLFSVVSATRALVTE